MRNFFRGGYKGVSETWNVVQHELECCGTQSYTDWINTTFSARENVPDSCCLSDVVGCGLGILNLGRHQVSLYFPKLYFPIVYFPKVHFPKVCFSNKPIKDGGST